MPFFFARFSLGAAAAAVAALSVCVSAAPLAGAPASALSRYLPPADAPAARGAQYKKMVITNTVGGATAPAPRAVAMARAGPGGETAEGTMEKLEEKEVAATGVATEKAAAEEVVKARSAESDAEENVEIATLEAAMAKSAAENTEMAAASGVIDPAAAKGMVKEYKEIARVEEAAAGEAKRAAETDKALEVVAGVVEVAEKTSMPEVAAGAKAVGGTLAELHAALAAVAKLGSTLARQAARLPAAARARVAHTEVQLEQEKELVQLADMLVANVAAPVAEAAVPMGSVAY